MCWAISPLDSHNVAKMNSQAYQAPNPNAVRLKWQERLKEKTFNDAREQLVNDQSGK